MVENKEKLDKIDKKIMRELGLDSRQPYAQIAKKTGLKMETVKYRVDRMLKDGVIARLFAQPNAEKLGLKTFRIYLKVNAIGRSKEAELFKEYASKPNVLWVASGEGEWSYQLSFMLKSESEFKKEIEQFMQKYGKYVTRKSIALGMYYTFLPLTYLAGGTREARLQTESSGLPARLSKKDHAILHALYENARTPTTELAKRLHVTPESVQYRLKKLEASGVIEGYYAWFEPQRYGYEYFKLFIWLQNATPEREKALARYCEGHPNVVFFRRILGDWDFEIDIHAANTTELRTITREINGKFPDLVREHATMTVLQNNLANPLGQFIQVTNPQNP